MVVRVRSATPDRERLIAAWRAAIELSVREPSLVIAPLELSDGSLLAELSGFMLSLWSLASGKRCSGRSEAFGGWVQIRWPGCIWPPRG